MNSRQKWKHWLKWTAAAAAIAAVLVLTADIYGYNNIRVSRGTGQELPASLMETVAKGKQVRLSERTDFDWDRMAVLSPYMTAEMIESAVGAEWTTAMTYPGYVLLRLLPDLCDMCNEDRQRLLFVKNERVVADVFISRYMLDFTGVGGYDRDNEPVIGLRSMDSPLVVKAGP